MVTKMVNQKIDEESKYMLSPNVQRHILKHLKRPNNLLVGFNETPESTLAKWIYQDCLKPLGF